MTLIVSVQYAKGNIESTKTMETLILMQFLSKITSVAYCCTQKKKHFNGFEMKTVLQLADADKLQKRLKKLSCI